MSKTSSDNDDNYIQNNNNNIDSKLFHTTETNMMVDVLANSEKNSKS